MENIDKDTERINSFIKNLEANIRYFQAKMETKPQYFYEFIESVYQRIKEHRAVSINIPEPQDVQGFSYLFDMIKYEGMGESFLIVRRWFWVFSTSVLCQSGLNCAWSIPESCYCTMLGSVVYRGGQTGDIICGNFRLVDSRMSSMSL